MTETKHIRDLIPDAKNANRGTERGNYLLEKSLERYGAGRSILLDREGRIIAGNKTAAKAGELGIEDVIVVQTDGTRLVAVQRVDLDLERDAAAKELAVADNRVGQIDLEWDPEALASLQLEGADLTAFWKEDELDALLAGFAGDGSGDGQTGEAPEPEVDRAEELREKWQTERGQLWQIGRHRLLCGDSMNAEDMKRLLDGARPGTLFYDPPWDAAVTPPLTAGHTLAFTDGGRAADVVGLFGAPTWVFVWDGVTSWYTPNRPLRRMKLCFWYGDLAAYDFDGAHYGEPGEAKEVTNPRGTYDYVPDQRGKHLADVFKYPLTRLHADGLHKHEKPLDWVRLLLGCCTQGDVLDPFIGSGTSLVACEQLGRVCYGMDLDPAAVAIALDRVHRFGLEPEQVA